MSAGNTIERDKYILFDPAKFRERAWGWALACAALALALAPRLAMLTSVERRLDADESIVGLMASHIARGEGVPLFFYGQHYGGGHVIEALVAAAWRLVSPGPSEAAVHASPIIFSVLTILLIFSTFRREYGLRAATTVAVLLSFSTPYLKSSLKADGYIETIFLGVLALTVCRAAGRALQEGKSKRAAFLCFATGALLGLSVWSYDFAIIYLAVVFLTSCRKALMSPARFFIFIAGLAAGATPMIIDNLRYDFAHLKHFTSGAPGAARGAASLLGKTTSMFTDWIPAFFTPDCVHNFVLPAPWYAWCICAAMIPAAAMLIKRRRQVYGEIALVPILVVAASVATGYAGASPRYLLPMEPYISMGFALALFCCFTSRRYVTRVVGVGILALLATGLFSGFSATFSDDSIMEGNVKTDPESLVQVVEFLEDNDVTCVHTTYFIKWRILFLTDEKINAIDVKAREREQSYTRYEDKGCPPGAPYAYVLHKASRYRYRLAARMNREGRYKMFNTGDHVAVIQMR